ncbi:MAG: arginine--tRNA ligase [Deltaproteobacteria bacterium]|nr:arginine--tRNA ligase [Deltaproteobacteria bacterium]
MQTVKGIITNTIKQAIISLQEKGVIKVEEPPPVLLEKPRKGGFGDIATNVAMVLASREGRPAREMANLILKEIVPSPLIEKFEVAGPGFINIFMDRAYWIGLLKDIPLLGDAYGRLRFGEGRKVQVEFVSANPTGPLHIGHGRGAAIGDVLANILEAAGFEVTREYYINDVGRQMEVLGGSLYLRYMELLGEKVDFPEDHYKGGYMVDIAKDFLSRFGDRFKGSNDIHTFTRFAADSIMEGIRKDLSDFGVRFDIYYNESSLFEKNLVQKTIEDLKVKGLVYEGEGALWFRTTAFGDDKDRVLIKSDSSTTYFASDIAYHRDKMDRGFERIIDIWGADHHGYQPRMKALFKAFGRDEGLEVVLVQLVSLLRGGVPVAMSTRAGEFVTLREVLDEVGRDAARFFFLTRRSDAHLEFDLELAKKETPENPVFYVQYAHARVCSIMEFAKERGINLPSFDEVSFDLLNLPEELAIIKALASFPEVVEGSAVSLEPHRITFYLQGLAGLFHPYYNKNRVISDDLALTKARLYLSNALRVVLRNGLGLLGVYAPEKM